MKLNAGSKFIKSRKYIIGIILALVTIAIIACSAIRTNAENAEVSAGEIEDEKTIVRISALHSRGNSANSKVDKTTFETHLAKYAGNGKTTVAEKEGDNNTLVITFTETGNQYEINVNKGPEFDSVDNSGSGGIEYVSPLEIFDADGTNVDGLHIGDFVNYDAGTWTQEEIDAIQVGPKSDLVTASGSTELIYDNYLFGGFAAGSSRNGNATPAKSDYDYVKDASTGEGITGWRVFDIEDDGTVTLISAGNPESYYHLEEMGYEGWISEYILTGNVNSDWNEDVVSEIGEASDYQTRDWSNYINESKKATNATVLTKSRLDSWYSKYIDEDADTSINATFRMIHQEPYIKYQNLVENYSYYWLATGDWSSLYAVYPTSYSDGEPCVFSTCYEGFGVRILVTLSPEVKFTAEKTGTKTLTGGMMDTYGGDQTYNCWGIKTELPSS